MWVTVIVKEDDCLLVHGGVFDTDTDRSYSDSCLYELIVDQKDNSVSPMSKKKNIQAISYSLKPPGSI